MFSIVSVCNNYSNCNVFLSHMLTGLRIFLLGSEMVTEIWNKHSGVVFCHFLRIFINSSCVYLPIVIACWNTSYNHDHNNKKEIRGLSIKICCVFYSDAFKEICEPCTMVRRGDKTYLVILSYYNIFGLWETFRYVMIENQCFV